MSRIIRAACHSRFSHVDIVVPGEGLLGASGPDASLSWKDPGGVQMRPFEPWPYEIKRTITVETDKADAVIGHWRGQIGKPFDDGALKAFMFAEPSHDWRELDRWFCSEGVIWSCEVAGVFPWALCVPMNKVDPNDCMMMLNPFMSGADIHSLLN